MGINLISSGDKAAFSSAFEDLHATFARPVLIWRNSERVLIEEVDENFNSFYRSNMQPSVSESHEEVSGAFSVRINWLDPKKEVNLPNGYEIRDDLKSNICRLKMKKDAFDFIHDCQKIEVDGRICETIGVSRPHGLIDTQFFTVFAREVS